MFVSDYRPLLDAARAYNQTDDFKADMKLLIHQRVNLLPLPGIRTRHPRKPHEGAADSKMQLYSLANFCANSSGVAAVMALYSTPG